MDEDIGERDSMKEIGGYMEFETYYGHMLHSEGIKLNCGRSCLAYLILARQIKKIVMPYLMCDSIFKICRNYGVEIRYYHVDLTFKPESISLAEDEWLYLMDFYGQISTDSIEWFVCTYKRVIIDFAQSYFREPIYGVDTLYTCRKFFGVPDGGIIYTNAKEPCINIETDESFNRLHHLLGRFERSAAEFYDESMENNKCFMHMPIRKMSKLTENLLRGIDYKRIRRQRTENFDYLHERLGGINQLHLQPVEGAFAYPLLIENGAAYKKQLISKKIYVPTLWPNVLNEMEETTLEYQMVNNILPLPCDQRYTIEDMKLIISKIYSCVYG